MMSGIVQWLGVFSGAGRGTFFLKLVVELLLLSVAVVSVVNPASADEP